MTWREDWHDARMRLVEVQLLVPGARAHDARVLAARIEGTYEMMVVFEHLGQQGNIERMNERAQEHLACLTSLLAELRQGALVVATETVEAD